MMTRLATLAALVVILGAYRQADAQASNVSKLLLLACPTWFIPSDGLPLASHI